MTHRYRTTLRPASQLNLRRLGYVEGSDRPATRERFDHGSFATDRELTDFEVSQLDLEFMGEEDDTAEHDGCGGELILPLHIDGSHYRPPVDHPQHCNPDWVMVTCDRCAVVNFTNNPDLKRLARTRRQRFVVEAV